MARSRACKYATAHMTMATTALYTQRNPFAAERTGGYRITPAGAPKDCQHHVISLAGSGIAYKPGDALGVWARNLDALVDAIVRRLGATGDEPVTIAGQTLAFREALAT